jgi:hypothetical protein
MAALPPLSFSARSRGLQWRGVSDGGDAGVWREQVLAVLDVYAAW